MRTMLISLILICSLAQVAIAGLPAPVEVDSGGCGTIYTCFAPEKCKDQSVTTIASSGVVEITKTDKILNDCDAIIRFYRYDEKRTLVSIESFQDTVKKIEFKQEEPGARDNDPRKLLNFFSCECDKTTGKKRGMFFDKLILDEAISLGKLKCTFVHKGDPPHENNVYMISEDLLTIVTYQENPSTHAMVDIPTGKDSDTFPDVPVRCDPDNFEFDHPKDEQTKIYKKISTKNKPETYECDDDTSRFKMEFKEIGSNSYLEAKSIKCIEKGNKFILYDANNQPTRFQGSFEIRCVAESKFFCKYTPKVKDGETSLTFEEKADGNSLKCPPNKPYFVIIGQIDRYLHNPEFKCIAVGENALWSIKSGNSVEIFPKDGKTVFCTDQLKCKKPISARAVEDGTLGRDAFPKCFKYGTLKTADTKEVATNFTCDTKIGEYKYTAGGQAKIIDDTTKFICEYPAEPTPPTFDEATKSKITTGVFVAFGLGAAFIIGSCAFSCFLMKQKMKRKKKAYLAEQARNVQYMTKEEKAAIKKKEKELRAKNPQKSGEKSKPAEKDETMEEQKAPVKTSQHQCMTKLGVTINAKDQKVDDNQGMKNDGAKKYEKRHMPKGIRGHRSTRIFKTLNSNNDVIVALVKEMDVKRKKGKIPGDNEC